MNTLAEIGAKKLAALTDDQLRKVAELSRRADNQELQTAILQEATNRRETNPNFSLVTPTALPTLAPHNVRLYMVDAKGNSLFRDIDKLNVFVSENEGDRLGTPEEQKTLLEEWIAERGNEQHDTTLTLVYWKLG